MKIHLPGIEYDDLLLTTEVCLSQGDDQPLGLTFGVSSIVWLSINDTQLLVKELQRMLKIHKTGEI